MHVCGLKSYAVKYTNLNNAVFLKHIKSKGHSGTKIKINVL